MPSPQRTLVTDWVFTFGGAMLLVLSGVTIAIGRGYPMWETRWIREAIIGSVASTTIWVLLLIPAQRRMLRLDAEHDSELRRVFRRWNRGAGLQWCRCSGRSGA